MKKLRKPTLSLFFTTLISISSVFTAAVTTFAWFQSSSSASVNSESTYTNISTAQPDVVHFYRFNGNGTPGGSSYVGYSNSAWAYGNTLNKVNTSNSTFTTDSGSHWTSTAWANAWTEIDIENNTDVTNSFDFSRMRPGCYYSFCVYFGVSTAKLKTTFSWNGGSDVTGYGKSPKRYVYDNGYTSYPINVLMGVNGWASNSTQSGSSTFINNTFSVDNSTYNDKIVYTNCTTGTTSESYYLLGTADAGVSLSTNQYIYFTIFMGLPGKADALMYRGTNGGNEYYERGNSNGGYGALDGLKSTLTSIELL